VSRRIVLQSKIILSEQKANVNGKVSPPLRGNQSYNPPPFDFTLGETFMDRLTLGAICGLVFGLVAAGAMLPMSFPNKTAAISAAFINRFAIGFLIGAARLPWPGWAVGLCVALLLSVPDAIITKAYAPIIGIGAVGGALIGWIIERFAR
jgi:hypothetical protein